MLRERTRAHCQFAVLKPIWDEEMNCVMLYSKEAIQRRPGFESYQGQKIIMCSLWLCFEKES